MLLDVKDINTYRGPAHILRGVSITVDTDEVVALVGRNGAGRTTIIESITGLLPVRSGHIRFRDEEITSLPPHRRAKRGIGYAPENSGIFPELTVAENLMISRWLSAKTGRSGANGGDSEEGAFRVFPEVRPLLARQGLNLSGGQVTAVVIEHDMDVVFRYSDRIVMMHEGAFLADGTPDEIRADKDVASILLGAPLEA